MVQQVRMLAVQSRGPGLCLWSPQWKGRIDSWTLTSDLHTVHGRQSHTYHTDKYRSNKMKHISISGINSRIYKGPGRDHNRRCNITNMLDLTLKNKTKQQKPHCSTHGAKPFKELPAYIILNFSPPSFSRRPLPSVLGPNIPGDCPLCCSTQ